MATDVPQRELRNRTADLLRRVEAGERLRITVHGHPVAELVPLEEKTGRRQFAPLKEIAEGLRGIMSPEEAREWGEELRQIRREWGPARDPFEKYEEQRAKERDERRTDES